MECEYRGVFVSIEVTNNGEETNECSKNISLLDKNVITRPDGAEVGDALTRV